MTNSLKIALASLLLLLITPTSGHAEAGKYYIPPSQINTAFQVMDRGFSNIFGMFQSATGAFTYDEQTKIISNVKIAIDASSLMVPNSSARQDLMTLLEPTAFPELSFMASSPTEFKDNKAEIKGTLKVHGQSKPATMEATLNHVGNSKNGGGLWSSEGAAVGLSLKGSIKRSDFGMGDEPEIPGRFGDTITLMIESEAIRQ